MMVSLEAGALDVIEEEEYYEVITEPDDFTKVLEALENDGYQFETAEIAMLPQTTTALNNEEMAEKMEKLLERLEDLMMCRTSIITGNRINREYRREGKMEKKTLDIAQIKRLFRIGIRFY